MLKERIQILIRICGGYISKFGLGRFLVAAMLVVIFAVGLVYGGVVIWRGLCGLLRSGGERSAAVASAIQSVVGLGVVLTIFLTGVEIIRSPSSSQTAWEEAPELDRSALQMLRGEERWAALDMDRKLEVLQVLVDAEREELGISERIYIRTELLHGKNGGYYDQEGCIRIDLEYLRTFPVEQVVRTVCHEIYHCYEYRLVEVFAKADPKNRGLKIFDSVADYQREFADYISDGKGYLNQMCENDARYYAAGRAEEYCRQSEPLP